MKRYLAIAITCIILLTISCKINQKEEQIINLDSLEVYKNSNFINPLDTIGRGYPIFYNMYLSVEISTLFKSAGVLYNSKLLNTHSKISDYITSDQKAINIGVYAVDLSYARVFEQYVVAGQYLSSIQLLALELSIPNDYFHGIVKRFEDNLDNRDSIVKIANEVYQDVEDHLVENERYATAALVVFGGWVEAMYIASQIINENPALDILERFAEQKYSLNNLIVLLSEYKENEVVKKYLLNLYEINRELQQLTFEFTADTTYNLNQINKYQAQTKVVTDMITALRSEIVE